MSDHLDNDKSEILYTDLFKIVSRIRLDDVSGREADIKNLQNLIQAHTQSKLKAFAGEVEEAITKTYKYNALDNRWYAEAKNELGKTSREALKAIKEKYQL